MTLKTTEEDEEEIQGVAANLSDEEETGAEAAEAACSSEPGGILTWKEEEQMERQAFTGGKEVFNLLPTGSDQRLIVAHRASPRDSGPALASKLNWQKKTDQSTLNIQKIHPNSFHALFPWWTCDILSGQNILSGLSG